MSTFEFDRATEVVAGGRTEIHDGWDIGGNANGGYLLAVAARGMAILAARPDPITITGHFLAPGRPGPATVTGEVFKAGRRFVTVGAALRSGGATVVQAQGSFGDLTELAGGFEHVTGGPPDLPDYASCPPRSSAQGAFPVALMNRLDVRLHPDDVGFTAGQPSGSGTIRGWFAFADQRPVDALALLLVCDALPPAVFNLPIAAGWVPTVEYTVHVRGVPAPGPLACVFRTRFVRNGCLEEDGEVWDQEGNLVAISRQLGLLPRA